MNGGDDIINCNALKITQRDSGGSRRKHRQLAIGSGAADDVDFADETASELVNAITAMLGGTRP
jgi:hypothetical protein